jgi:hypothetical protein
VLTAVSLCHLAGTRALLSGSRRADPILQGIGVTPAKNSARVTKLRTGYYAEGKGGTRDRANDAALYFSPVFSLLASSSMCSLEKCDSSKHDYTTDSLRDIAKLFVKLNPWMPSVANDQGDGAIVE